MSHNVQDVFNLLSADPKFIERLETSINNIMKDGKIDQYDVPEFIFIITDAYNQMSQFRLTYDDLPKLIKMIYAFMVDKLNLIPEDKRLEFERLVDSALRLVMIQPVINKAVTSCFSKIFPCCFRTQTVAPTPKVEVLKDEKKADETQHVASTPKVEVEVLKDEKKADETLNVASTPKVEVEV